MNELEIIQKEGFITSKELELLLNKNIRNIIKQLNSLELRGEIHIIKTVSHKGLSRIYINNEIYNDLCQVK